MFQRCIFYRQHNPSYCFRRVYFTVSTPPRIVSDAYILPSAEPLVLFQRCIFNLPHIPSYCFRRVYFTVRTTLVLFQTRIFYLPHNPSYCFRGVYFTVSTTPRIVSDAYILPSAHPLFLFYTFTFHHPHTLVLFQTCISYRAHTPLYCFRRVYFIVCTSLRTGSDVYILVSTQPPYSFRRVYRKFGNFRVTFISRIFCFRIISEFLNSRASTRTVYKAYSYSSVARTLDSRGNKFANISEN